MAYITSTQFVRQYDRTRVCELLANGGDDPIAVSALSTNEKLADFLEAASGLIDSACLVAERYSPESLQTLADDDDSRSGALLRRIAGDLAYGMLIASRGLSLAEVTQQAPMYAMALSFLESLRLGERLFPIDETEAAGLPDVVKVGSTLDTAGTSINSKTRLWGCIGQTNLGY